MAWYYVVPLVIYGMGFAVACTLFLSFNGVFGKKESLIHGLLGALFWPLLLPLIITTKLFRR